MEVNTKVLETGLTRLGDDKEVVQKVDVAGEQKGTVETRLKDMPTDQDSTNTRYFSVTVPHNSVLPPVSSALCRKLISTMLIKNFPDFF